MAGDGPGDARAEFVPTTGGYCEAQLDPRCGGIMTRTRARWVGPQTYSGGDLYCGRCKQARQNTCPAVTPVVE